MNLNFLQLPEAERKLYFDQTAIQRNVSPILYREEPLSFDEIMATLTELEQRINSQ